jgi:hypothetical protein
VRNTLVPKEEDLRLSISHHDKEIGEHTFLPQALHAGLTDESFSGRFSRDADGFLSWVRTVQRIEGKHLPKGMYIDTFV